MAFDDGFDENYSFWKPYETSYTPDTTTFKPDYSLGSTDQTGYFDAPSNFWGNNPSAYTSTAPSYNNPSAYTYTAPSYNNPSAYTTDLAQSPLNAAIASGAVLTPGNTGGDTGDNKNKGDNSWWRWKNKEFLPELTPGQVNTARVAGGFLELLQKMQQAKDLRSAARTMDPFGAQRPFYQQELQQTYTDPNAYMNRPESRLQMQALEKALARRDAKAGRRSQYGARALELQQAQAKGLADYRNALLQPAGAGIGPNSAQLLSNAALAKQQGISAPFQSLQDIVTGTQPGYKDTQYRIAALEKAFLNKKG